MLENLQQYILASSRQDRESQKKLYSYYSPYLYAVARRYVNNHQDAEDIIQEAWLSIFKALDSYVDQGKFKSWLKTIVIRQAWKANKKKITIEELSDHFDDVQTPALDEQVLDQLTCEQILNMLEMIPQGSRVVFKMYVLDGFMHKEISTILNIKESSSRVHLAKARKILKNAYLKLDIQRNGIA